MNSLNERLFLQIDGISHVPKTVDGFEIFVGQRYSVVVNANQPIRNYWIRAPMDLQHHSDNDNRQSLMLSLFALAPY
jgi:FtsP/CotA-like multicopper oxidase with cupredoxin domain